MKSEAIQTYKSPRWIAFYLSLAMMVVGFIGCQRFEYISRLRHEKFGDDDIFAMCFFIIGVIGGFIFIVSGLLILVAALLRRKFPKHFTR